MTLSGTVTDFDAALLESIRSSILNQFSGADNVRITILPASVTLRIEVVYPPTDAGRAAAGNGDAIVRSVDTATIQNSWLPAAAALTVEGISEPTPSIVEALAPSPPPPVPAPPLASMNEITPRGAVLSSPHPIWGRAGAQHDAAKAIDANLGTWCHSTASATGAWLSVQVPPESEIGYVAIYNRDDVSPFMEWLTPFEVWIGATAGDTTPPSATKCGGPYSVPAEAGPFMVECGGARGEFVTYLQTNATVGTISRRYLTVAEVKVYERASGYPAHPPAGPVPPLPPPLPPSLQPSPPSPPSLPATPAPPLSTLVEVPLSAAQMNVPHRLWGFGPYAAHNIIDGDANTICHSQDFENTTADFPELWVSAAMPTGTAVGEVVIWNRNDITFAQPWAVPFEVFVGRTIGDVSSPFARSCGGLIAFPPLSGSEWQQVRAGAGPFAVDCNGQVGDFVTYIIRNPERLPGTYLSIAEIKVYAANTGDSAAPPMAPLASPPPPAPSAPPASPPPPSPPEPPMSPPHTSLECVANPSFEDGDEGWSSEGGAFSGFPSSSGSVASGAVDGRYVATTVVSGDTATGRLSSSTFTITSRWLCFHSSGWSSFTGIDISPFDGIPEVRAPMPAAFGWSRTCLDLITYVGYQARVILADEDGGVAYGWGSWDHFICVNDIPDRVGGAPPPPLPAPPPPPPPSGSCVANPSLEGGTRGWRIVADGGIQLAASGVSSVLGCADGVACIISGEAATGQVVSEMFTVSRPWLCWRVAGYASYAGVDVGNLDGTPEVQAPMPAADSWRRVCVDLSGYVGQQARVVVGDTVGTLNANAWGMWDGWSCEDADRSD